MSNNHTPATKLVSMNIGGNLHVVASYVTKFGLSDFFVHAEGVNGLNSVVLFRLPLDWPTDSRGPLPAVVTEPEATPTPPPPHVCKFEDDPQPHNRHQSKCKTCGETLPF